ncbi:MAG: tetratricopeptide repeat protein [Candidatus Hydrogenedentes bacterium]|nr:tetratricopeptide repeat protein [Candidatus Hydrogenedentota bacterium]
MTDSHTPNTLRSPIAISLLLALVITALFWEVRYYDFAPVDDYLYITDNPYVLEGLTQSGLEQAFFHFNISNWSPLALLSLMLDSWLLGTEPGGYHTTALVLHALNSVLLFLVLSRLTGAHWRSAFVAALFAVHPLHVEPVAWISSRKDVLSALFWILTIGCYVRFLERRTRYRYIALTGMFILGLMAKSMVLTLPFVLLLLDYWPLKRFGEDFRIQPSRVRELIIEKIPLFVLTGVSVVLTYMASSSGDAVRNLSQIPLSFRLQNMPVAYVLYVAKSVWPSDLVPVGYPIPRGASPLVLCGAILFLLSITAISIRLRRAAPYLIVGWLWFLGTLVPVIGLVSIGSTLRTDRYMYIPLIGLSIGIVWAVYHGLNRVPIPRKAIALAGSVVLVCYALLSWFQIAHWRDARSLYTQMLKADPDSARGHHGMGGIYAEEGNLPEAIGHYIASIRTVHTNTGAHVGLGNVFFRSGNYAKARDAFRFAIRLEPGNAPAFLGLGLTQSRMGKLEDAEQNLLEALRLRPDLRQADVELKAVRERMQQRRQGV